MPLDHWLAFIAASAVLLAIPGPTVLLVISCALGHGRRPAVAGVAPGDLSAMTASMLGLGAVLATWPPCSPGCAGSAAPISSTSA